MKYQQFSEKIVVVRSKILDSLYEENMAVYQEDVVEFGALQKWIIKEQRGGDVIVLVMTIRHRGWWYATCLVLNMK